jgi:hypothetical protein
LETLREIAADDFGKRVPPFARSKRPGRGHERARLGQSDHLPPAPVVEHFTIRFLAQPPKQIGSGKETIGNYLQAFVTPEIAQVFCPGANTFASPTSTAERYRRLYAARIPGGVPLREHVLEDALLCF